MKQPTEAAAVCRAVLKEKYQLEMWPDDKIRAFRKALLDWYDSEKRDLPWRRTHDPYAIWVSEIMLQQTRVDTVIPYFYRFMGLFPTVQTLAEAPEDRLLKAWEGLGYYSRVRNMQKAAQQVMTEFGGDFPDTLAAISRLKGIGPYTAGAIASIAFGLPEPAVDGNVMRVFSRIFEIDADIAKPASRKIFELVGYCLIDPQRPGDFNQALMDLGSSICTPVNPRPEISPIRDFNAAYLHGTMAKYPVKSKAKKPVPQELQGLILQNARQEFLLEQRPAAGLLANFWTFPLVELQQLPSQIEAPADGPEQLELLVAEKSEVYEAKGGNKKTPAVPMPLVLAELTREVEEKYRLEPVWLKQETGKVKHIFSHRTWNITGYYARVQQDGDEKLPSNCRWVKGEDFEKYAFPVAQQKMWEQFRAFAKDRLQ